MMYEFKVESGYIYSTTKITQINNSYEGLPYQELNNYYNSVDIESGVVGLQQINYFRLVLTLGRLAVEIIETNNLIFDVVKRQINNEWFICLKMEDAERILPNTIISTLGTLPKIFKFFYDKELEYMCIPLHYLIPPNLEEE